ncbi:phosphoribosyl-AMP cyclohydrolase [Tepidiforma sp.]|uniref:phosphoribosyl-AMP cyclohydrolase n=1 Tax=Tepidiforma sp. TaxID=2682230 RepID=UPI002ADE76A5|nr:phosphoribosyl-AMP cyclohydrolase [Tepidiforma sp.]
MSEAEVLAFGPDGLLPAVVQHAETGEVLILAFMNREALERTLQTGLVTFFSRSRGQLWVKGETSGNYLRLVSIAKNCEANSLLIRARPDGPACHTGNSTCFYRPLDPATDLPPA